MSARPASSKVIKKPHQIDQEAIQRREMADVAFDELSSNPFFNVNTPQDIALGEQQMAVWKDRGRILTLPQQ